MRKQDVNAVAGAIAKTQGWAFPDGCDLTKSTNPRAREWCAIARASIRALEGQGWARQADKPSQREQG